MTSTVSPKEARAAIVENRALLQAALHGAATNWERKPEAGAGEDAWSPKQTAEHLIDAELFFTSAIAQACGAPALERPKLEVAAPADAAATATRVGATCDNILRHVSDGDLPKTWELRGLGVKSVAEMLAIMNSHAQDHVSQIKAAS